MSLQRPSVDASSLALSTEELCVGYGEIVVARDLELTVEQGEIVALLGRNGVGKTSTLLTIAGVHRSLGGRVRVSGRVCTGPLHRRVKRFGLALVTEERAIIRRLTVAENLSLGTRDVAGALDMFPELRPLMRKKAGLLSGGEQQMLALGRAMSNRPRLLLIDELSLGLAPLVVERLLEASRAAADAWGVGILLVEQHAHLALAVADRGYVLSQGSVALSGTGSELRARMHEIEAAYLSSAALSDGGDGSD